MDALLANERRYRQRGFTLVELVTTLILIGILAAAVVPRFFGDHGFEERGFYDETIAALRYAQKSAIARRRTVCVTFTQTEMRFRVATNFGTITCDATDLNLPGPDGAAAYTIDAAENTKYGNLNVEYAAITVGAVAFPGPPTVTLNFLPSGASSAAAMIQIANFATPILVEAETGYVH